MATDLKISLNLRDDDGFAKSQEELFTLQNLARLNTKNTTAVTGKWSSSSAYLGQDFGGKYYVTRQLLGPEKNWAVTVLASGNLLDDPFLPVGFFFDSGGEAPFLVLEGFEPLKLTIGSMANHGVGHLLRSPLQDTLSSFNLSWKVGSALLEL
jgi:hypothetical protein